jgi:hypothetical protein
MVGSALFGISVRISWPEHPVSREPQPVMPRLCLEILNIVVKG